MANPNQGLGSYAAAQQGIYDPVANTLHRPAPTPAVAPVNPSFVGSIDGALVCCEQTAMRLDKVVERLCGPLPAEGEATEGLRSGGLLDAADAQGGMIRSLSRRMNAALDYLESKLP